MRCDAAPTAWSACRGLYEEGGKPKAGEYILICLSGLPTNAKVSRTAARMAEAFHGTFTALFEESSKPLNEAYSRHLQNNLKLVKKLEARITTVYSDDSAVRIARYTRVSSVSKILIGRSPQKREPFALLRSLVDRLNELALALDI